MISGGGNVFQGFCLSKAVVREPLFVELFNPDAFHSLQIGSSAWRENDGRILRAEVFDQNSLTTKYGQADVLHDDGGITLNSRIINLDATALGRGLADNDTLADLINVSGTNFGADARLLYDQTGNGRHLVSRLVSSALSPRFFNQITNDFERNENGDISLFFSGTRAFDGNSDLETKLSENSSLYVASLFQDNLTSTRSDLVYIANISTPFGHLLIDHNFPNNNRTRLVSRRIASDSAAVVNPVKTHNNNLQHYGGLNNYGAGSATLYINNNNEGSASFTTGTSGNVTVGINANRNIGNTVVFIGCEWAWFTDMDLNQISAINQNQMSRWGL